MSRFCGTVRDKMQWRNVFPLVILLCVLVSACSITPLAASSSKSGPITVQLFYHSGQEAERAALSTTLQTFNDSHPNIHVEAVQLPEGNYIDQVNVAALSHSLPCLLDFDGPTLYRYAWSGYLVPLDNYVPSQMRNDFLPSILQQGTYNQHLYSLGQYDSGLGFYANKQYLRAAGVRIPTIDSPWTLSEFNRILASLKQRAGLQYPLELNMNGGNEWFTYGFSPFVESFGGDLINRRTYQSAKGKLNGSDAVAAMTWFQNLFKQGYSDPWPVSDTDFTSGRAALDWGGHWLYAANQQALGNNLLVLPAPNLGKGMKTGMGSWSWGITSSCKTPDAAWQVLNFILSSSEITRMTNANGAVPARKSVIAQSQLYAPKGPLHVFALQLLRGIAEPRPITPAYPIITSAFSEAVIDIVDGFNVKKELDIAAQKIDQDIQDNEGYPTQ
ncbi:MAG TPA: sugar ABC transporter substrate-binding protein [Ktedonobacteraceae bacterium]|nr:sugar ABC transporter substrate-binding protein [Ktedonobacteraceae bacterium]